MSEKKYSEMRIKNGKTKHLLITFYIFLFLFNICFSQEVPFTQNEIDLNVNQMGNSQKDDSQIKPLKVGDKVPEIIFKKILNAKNTSGKISDYKGKFLILDFWFTSCIVCIKQFPKITKLQEEFKDSLVILPVGFNITIPHSIEQYVKENKGTNKEMILPTVVQNREDSLIRMLFPTTEMPYEIWIDPEGYVRAFTDHLALTKGNIQRFLNNPKEAFLPIKENPIRMACNSEFLIPRSSSLIFASQFSTKIDNLVNINPFGRQCDSSVTRLFEVNASPHLLYREAYELQFPEIMHDPFRKRILVETRDVFYSDDVNNENLDNWETIEYERKNYFCYELIIAGKRSIVEACNFMIKDLDRFFSVKSSVCERVLNSFGLQFDSVSYKETFKKMKTESLEVKLSDLIYKLNTEIKDTIVINESHVPDEYTLLLPFNIMQLSKQEYISNLKKFGFSLIQARRKLKVLLITN